MQCKADFIIIAPNGKADKRTVHFEPGSSLVLQIEVAGVIHQQLRWAPDGVHVEAIDRDLA